MLRHLVHISAAAKRPAIYIHKRNTCCNRNIKHTFLNLDHGMLHKKHKEFSLANHKDKRNHIIATSLYGLASGVFMYAGTLWIDNGSSGVGFINVLASGANAAASISSYRDYKKCRIAQDSFDKFILHKEGKLNLNHNDVDKLLDDFIDYI